MPSFRIFPLLPLVALLWLAACDDSPTEPPGPLPVTEVEFLIDSLHLFVSEDVQLEVVLRTEDGTEVEDRDVDWSSSDPEVVSVTQDGLARGEGEGDAVITAESEGVSASLPVTVEDAPEIDITAIEPDTLVEGETIVIQGIGLATGGRVVRIAGMEATVLSASDEELEVEVPRICRPTGPVEVSVEIMEGAVVRAMAHPARGGPPLDMAPGEFRLITDPADFCLTFEEESGAEKYLFGVQSTSTAVASLTPVRVEGAVSGDVVAEAGAARIAGSSSPRARGLPFSRLVDPDRRRWERHHRAEAEVRRADLALGRELLGHRISPDVLADGVPSTASSVPPGVSEGDTIEIRVPDIDAPNSCQEYVAATTVVRTIGERGVWLEDVENPDDGFEPGDIEDLSEAFDDFIHPAIAGHFGEPTDIDGNDRIVIVITQEVNEFERNILGFVSSADFAPRTAEQGPSCRSSDEGEIFYTRTPGPGYERSVALADFPRLVAHEMTHIIQLGRRIVDDRPDFQTIWELEGQAVLGEEVAGHAETGRAPRQNLGLDVVFNEGAEEVTDTEWYLNGFIDLFTYYGAVARNGDLEKVDGAPEECTWLATRVDENHGAPCEMGGREPYGVAWSFLRWVSDHFHAHFPGGEADFHQGLIDANTSGFSTIENLTGEPREILLAQWAASHYADGRIPPDGEPRVTFPSWDLEEVHSGVVPAARLQPRERDFSSFSDELAVRAASSAYFVLEGSDRPETAVRARTLGLDLLPDLMQLWVVRIQ